MIYYSSPQDTAGSERYEAMSRIYYRGAKAAIVCYDLSDGSSFDRAKFWINELQQNEEVKRGAEHKDSMSIAYTVRLLY